MAKVQDVGFIKPAAPSIFNPQQELDIKRKRAMAEAMMKGGEQPTGTEMVSGIAVKQSPLAALARAIQQGVGGYQAGQADKSEADMNTGRQQRLAQAIQSGKLDSLASGSPEEQMLALKSNMDIQSENRKYAHDLELAKKKASGGGGGATGALADRLIAQGVDPIAAILIAKSGVDHGTTISGNTVSPLAGAPETFGTISEGKKTGELRADLALKPTIAGEEEGAKQRQKLAYEPQTAAATETAKNNAAAALADTKTLPIIDELSALNKDTFDMPYAGKAQGIARMIPGTDTQTTAMDLMLQNRIEAAAPLAKQLGVNPTDKDFQASLDRIFNADSTKAARQAEIDNIGKRIRDRRASTGASSDGAKKVIRYDAKGNRVE